MKFYKTKQYTREVEVIDKVVCDLCGRESDHLGWGKGKGRVDTQEVTVKLKEGEEYPSGGIGTAMVFDICPDCFKNKLVAWLKEQGAEPTIEEWDY